MAKIQKTTPKIENIVWRVRRNSNGWMDTVNFTISEYECSINFRFDKNPFLTVNDKDYPIFLSPFNKQGKETAYRNSVIGVKIIAPLGLVITAIPAKDLLDIDVELLLRLCKA